MSIYERDGKWHCEGYFWDERTGQRTRYRKSTGIRIDGTTRTKRIAEQVAAKIAQSYASGSGRRARPLTLANAIKIHIARLERGDRSQATINIVIEKAVHLYNHFSPDYDCNALTTAALAEYADARLKMFWRPGKPVSRGTVHREIRTFRESLVSAKTMGKFDGVIPDAPDLGTVYTPRERWLPKAESQAVLLALNIRWRDHFVMYRQTGIDRMELYAIDPRADVLWNERELRIRGTKNKFRDRRIPMTPEVHEIVERRASKGGPLFDFWHQDLRDIKRACKRAGFEPCCLKDLRRSFATDMAMAGQSILLVSRLMGHASTRMLERVYAQVSAGQHMHDVIRSVAEMRPGANIRVEYVTDTAAAADSVDGSERH